MEQLSRSMLDGEYVPVPETSSQGVRGMLTKQAREFPKEKVNGLEAIITYLKDNKWWDIARPMDMAEDMLDMMQKTCWTWCSLCCHARAGTGMGLWQLVCWWSGQACCPSLGWMEAWGTPGKLRVLTACISCLWQKLLRGTLRTPYECECEVLSWWSRMDHPDPDWHMSVVLTHKIPSQLVTSTCQMVAADRTFETNYHISVQILEPCGTHWPPSGTGAHLIA